MHNFALHIRVKIMLLSIIIVSYNVRHYLWQCIGSIQRSVEYANIPSEIFVVDNNSSDNSLDYLRQEFSHLLCGQHSCLNLYLIANRCNVGFGKANNQALRQSKGKYILFLNPDTILTEQTLIDCFRYAEQESQLGGIGVKMLRSNGLFAYESRRGLPTPWTAFCKMSGLTTLFPKSKWLGKYYMRYLDENKAHPIEIVSGAFMFCSKEALDQCGGFDEDFFMYGEDIDLSYRFLKAGRKNLYVPTPILHYKGESTQKNSFRYVHVFYQAMLIFFRKHFPTSACLLGIPVYFLIYIQAFLTLIIQNIKVLSQFFSPVKCFKTIRLSYQGALSSKKKLLSKQDIWGIEMSLKDDTFDKIDILAFDAESKSYIEILRTLEESNHCAHIGTYFPSRNLLITRQDIYN